MNNWKHKCKNENLCGMSDTYNDVAERLWEKIEYHKDRLDLEAVDFHVLFPLDQLAEKSPLIKRLVAEVNDEFNYEMSERQASWAIVKAIRDDLGRYSKENKLSLVARP